VASAALAPLILLTVMLFILNNLLLALAFESTEVNDVVRAAPTNRPVTVVKFNKFGAATLSSK
jgi:hypothetical protein